MTISICTLPYINRIAQNVEAVKPLEVENLYHDITNAGVILPSGEGRSKGALSIACSEMAKMKRGKTILDRGDIGFPGRGIDETAPTLKQRFGQVCLLVNSGSGKSLMPLIDAQKLAFYIAKSGSSRNFTIDAVTSHPDSPIGRLGSKFGNVLELKGRESEESLNSTSEFRALGIMEDVFILGSGGPFHSMAEAMYEEASANRVVSRSSDLLKDIGVLVENIVSSDFFVSLLSLLEQRHSCFFAGLGSAQEVARMTAVRLAHVKRAIGDQIFVAGESNTPAPRAGDILLVITQSGETEVVAAWCKNFKRMGGKVASIVGNSESTIAALSDFSYMIKGQEDPDKPNNFYIKAAFILSPLPIYLVEKIEERGLKLPEYIIKWYHSVTS